MTYSFRYSRYTKPYFAIRAICDNLNRQNLNDKRKGLDFSFLSVLSSHVREKLLPSQYVVCMHSQNTHSKQLDYFATKDKSNSTKSRKKCVLCCTTIVDTISNNNGTKTEKNYYVQLTTGKERNAMLGPTINNIINSILLSSNTFSCSFKTSIEHANSFLLSASYFPKFSFHARIKN